MAGLSASERAEFTNHLVRFLKSAQRANLLGAAPYVLASTWMSGIRKPAWMEERLATDLDFAVAVETFISQYAPEIDRYEEELAIPLRPKPSEARADAEALLAGVLAATGQQKEPQEIAALSDANLWRAIAKAFPQADDADAPIEGELAQVGLVK